MATAEAEWTIPSREELGAMEGALMVLSGEVESLSNRIAKIMSDESKSAKVTAEEAWHVTYFASGVRSVADMLSKTADQIAEGIESAYIDANERHTGEGGVPKGTWTLLETLSRRRASS